MAKKNVIKDEFKGLFPSDPVFRIPDQEIDSEFLVERAMTFAERSRNDRSVWYENRAKWYLGWDDYVSPIRKGAYDGESNYHLPFVEPQVESMKAQILASIFFNDTPFFISPGEEMDYGRIKKIMSWMRYVATRWANNYRGIYEVMHDWAHYLVVDGIGILGRDWHTQYFRYLDIERNEEYTALTKLLGTAKQVDMTSDEFFDNAKKIQAMPYKEVQKIGVTDYPLIRAIPIDNVLFKGHSYDSMDLNSHETVIEVVWFSKSQLLQMKYQGLFDEDVVDKIIARERDIYGSTIHSTRATQKEAYADSLTGVITLNAQGDTEEKYEFYKVFDKVSLDSKNKFGLQDRIVYWVHGATRLLAGWNYLDRISATRKLPLHMSHLYKRPGRTMGRGIVEQQHSTGELMDILVNQSVNGGLLANNPMFAWRAESNAFDPHEMRAEPGLGVKTEDPNADIRMLSFNINPTWAMSLMQYLETKAQQQSLIGSERFGQVGMRVGATRSNAGLQTLMSQSDRGLNVVFKHNLAPTLSEFFTGLYADSVERVPDDLMVPVVGMDGVHIVDVDGKPISDRLKREDLSKNIHFVFHATAASLNKEQKKAELLESFQLMTQPLFMKTGIVGTKQAKHWADYIADCYELPMKDRFINGADANDYYVPLRQEVLMIMQGMYPPISMIDPEHEIKIQFMEMQMEDERFLEEVQTGMVHKAAPQLLQKAIAEHTSMLELQNKAQALQNPTGSNTPITQRNTLGPQGEGQESSGNQANSGNEQTPQMQMQKGNSEQMNMEMQGE